MRNNTTESRADAKAIGAQKNDRAKWDYYEDVESEKMQKCRERKENADAEGSEQKGTDCATNVGLIWVGIFLVWANDVTISRNSNATRKKSFNDITDSRITDRTITDPKITECQ